MRIDELLLENSEKTFNELLDKFIPYVVKELELSSLPSIKLVKNDIKGEQPTFGRYTNKAKTIELSVRDRHPIDIMRTLAHELVHYKQDLDNRLGPHSGDTGSDIENEANAQAGIIMRNFNKKHPEFFDKQAITY